LLRWERSCHDSDGLMIEENLGRGSGRSTKNGSRADRAFKAASHASLLLIAFVAGAIVTAADTFPGAEIAKAYEGGKALYEKLTAYQQIYNSDLWFPERTQEKGVVTDLPGRTQSGVTLYTSGDGPAAYLMTMDGRVLHQWQRPYSTVWNKGASVRNPQPDSHIYFRDVFLYPNGDLLAVYEGVGDTPYGYGLVKLDRNSNVVWSYLANTHHVVNVGPDGRIYVLTHEFVGKAVNGDHYGNLASPRLDDFLVVLSPEGKELKKIALFDAVAHSRYAHLIQTVTVYSRAEPLHANDVEPITEEMAKNFPFGRAGQVLMSFRELGAIGVLDLDREELVWATRGSWIGQHDPDILPSGDILLFDNYANYSERNASRVIEFDPHTMEIDWQYSGTATRPFDSQIRSGQQRLANGNTLIVESNAGRILEVAPNGDVVWEFVNPVRGAKRGDRPLIPIIAAAQRIDPATLDPGLIRDEIAQR
jgi:hypothetical protein